MARASEFLFGNSTISFRLIACLFSSATVILTGHITMLLGGKKLAIAIACSAIICSPSVLATSYLLQPAVFDQFFWALFSFAILAYQKQKKIFSLYLASAALGLGMLNKYSIMLFAGSILLALLLVAPSSFFRNLKKLIGPVVLCLLIILPNLFWQWAYNFPIFHYTLSTGKSNFKVDFWDYLLQLFFFHGASVAIWTAGLIYLWFNQESGKQLRLWIITFLIIIVSLAFLKGKLYYGLGIFPLFFAAGGYCWSLMLTKSSLFTKTFVISMLYFFAILSLPIVIPVFSLKACRAYSLEMVRTTNFSRPLRYENGDQGKIPQFFADMTGWRELANQVNRIASTYKDSDKNATFILTNNYAIAGALKFYRKPNMPQVISATNSFLLYSPERLGMQKIIYLSKDPLSNTYGLAKNVKFLGKLETENSHINGISIYQLTIPSELMKKKYLNERELFYPSFISPVVVMQTIKD